MLYREIIAVCSQIHTKHINALWAEQWNNRSLFSNPHRTLYRTHLLNVSHVFDTRAMKHILSPMYYTFTAFWVCVAALNFAVVASLPPFHIGRPTWGAEFRPETAGCLSVRLFRGTRDVVWHRLDRFRLLTLHFWVISLSLDEASCELLTASLNKPL